MVKEILRPRTVREALAMGSRTDSAYLGGGTWFGSRRGNAPQTLISLEDLGLSEIKREGSRFEMGATATFQQVLDNPATPEGIRKAVSLTASRPLRNMVTVGGEIALRGEASALIPLLIALEAELHLAGEKKAVAVEDWWRGVGGGPHSHTGRAGGLILKVVVKDAFRPCSLESLSRTSHDGRSLVIAASAREVRPLLRGVRLVASDCRGGLARVKAVEKALEGGALPEKGRIEEQVRAAFSPQPDIHASAAYKGYMAGVIAADLVHALVGREAAQ